MTYQSRVFVCLNSYAPLLIYISFRHVTIDNRLMGNLFSNKPPMINLASPALCREGLFFGGSSNFWRVQRIQIGTFSAQPRSVNRRIYHILFYVRIFV